MQHGERTVRSSQNGQFLIPGTQQQFQRLHVPIGNSRRCHAKSGQRVCRQGSAQVGTAAIVEEHHLIHCGIFIDKEINRQIADGKFTLLVRQAPFLCGNTRIPECQQRRSITLIHGFDNLPEAVASFALTHFQRLLNQFIQAAYRSQQVRCIHGHEIQRVRKSAARITQDRTIRRQLIRLSRQHHRISQTTRCT